MMAVYTLTSTFFPGCMVPDGVRQRNGQAPVFSHIHLNEYCLLVGFNTLKRLQEEAEGCTSQAELTGRQSQALFTASSPSPRQRLRNAHGVELDDPGVGVQKAIDLVVAAGSNWVVRVLQVEVAVGQEAAAKQRDARSLELLLQAGNTGRHMLS